MNLKIQSLHFTSEPALNDHVTARINKLAQFYDRIESAEVCLRLVKSSDTQNKVCEIRLAVPGNDLFAERKAKTFEEAANEATDALHRQLEKLKTRFENSQFPR